MSEELIKNQPGESGELGGTTPGLYQPQGSFASGSDAGSNVPGNYTTGGVLGNIPNANLGLTTGPNAVNPSGEAGSGILRPEQAQRIS